MSGGGLVSVIMPNMQVLGLTISDVIAPYGTFGSTGTGGVGTYAVLGTPATAAITASITGTAMATTSGSSTLVVGSAISGVGVTSGTIITAVLGTNSFTVNNSQTVASRVDDQRGNDWLVRRTGYDIRLAAALLFSHSWHDCRQPLRRRRHRAHAIRPRRYVADDRVNIEVGRPRSSRLGWRARQCLDALGRVSAIGGRSAEHNFARKPLHEINRHSDICGGQQPRRSFALSPERSRDLGRFQQCHDHRVYRQRHRDGRGHGDAACAHDALWVACARGQSDGDPGGSGPRRRSLEPADDSSCYRPRANGDVHGHVCVRRHLRQSRIVWLACDL